MSEKKSEDLIVMLTNVRLAFPQLWTAKQVNGEGKAAFSASFLMPLDHPDVAKVRAAITEAAQGLWKSKAPETLRGLIAADRVCLHNGDAKAQFEGYAGNLFVSARSYNKPLILGQDPQAGPLEEVDGKPYSGCYVNAQVAIWAQRGYGGRVNAQFRGVQFLRDGEAFAGGVASQPDDFDPVDDSADADAPAAAGDEWGDLIS